MTDLMTRILQPWEARALENHLSRIQEQADLEAGRKSPYDVHRENGAFAFQNAVVQLDECKDLGFAGKTQEQLRL